MKPTALIALVAQVAYIIAMPAQIEDNAGMSSLEDRQIETPDILAKRGKCWYADHPNDGPTKCSQSGWCYGHCNLQIPENGEWCWLAYNLGAGDWVSCKSNADCSIAINKKWPERALCRNGCYC
jgi:hypothetical protein